MIGKGTEETWAAIARRAIFVQKCGATVDCSLAAVSRQRKLEVVLTRGGV